MLALLSLLADLLLPDCCLACHGPGASAGRLGLCVACRGQVVRSPRGLCGGCGRPLAGAGLPAEPRCGACRGAAGAAPAVDRTLTPWLFAWPLDRVLRGYKFRRLSYLGRPLAHALAAELGPALADGEVVVPVPLHWRRRLGRGYDQAGELARPLAAQLGVACVGALGRARGTRRQTDEDRAERAHNLRGAFAVCDPGAIRGRAVLLVDDVITTGATVEAAAMALRRAGARAVTAVAVARTPHPALRSRYQRVLSPSR